MHSTKKSKDFKMNKKSQVFTLDFFLAFFIFSILLVTTMVYWNNYSSKMDRNVDSNVLLTKAFQISNVLVKSEGYPADWNSDNVIVVGLAESDRVLSSDKVASFVSMPLNSTKDILQMHNFNFSFILKNADDDVLAEYGENPSDSKRAVAIRRYVTYNNDEAIFEFNMWEEK